MAGQITGAAASSRGKTKTKCPHCGDEEYAMSHRRNLFERLLSVGGIRPVRCLKCNERRFAFVGLGLFSPFNSHASVRKEP